MANWKEKSKICHSCWRLYETSKSTLWFVRRHTEIVSAPPNLCYYTKTYAKPPRARTLESSGGASSRRVSLEESVSFKCSISRGAASFFVDDDCLTAYRFFEVKRVV